MSLVKSVAAVDEWAEVAQNTVREGTIVDVSDCYSAILHVDCAISNTTAHVGTEIIIEISSNSSGDEDWIPLAQLMGPIGTAITLALAAQEAVAQTVISITDPAANNMDNDGKYKFIEHATVANSEIVFQTANSGDSDGDTITIRDGLTNQQETTSYIFDIDDATVEAVRMYAIEIPIAANRVRVTYDNTYDPNGATVHTKCRISKVTGI